MSLPAKSIVPALAVRFSLGEAQAASDSWGFNCGPGALCAILGMTPDELRPHLQGFEDKGHTNPTLMASILRGLRIPFYRLFEQQAKVRRECLKTPLYPDPGLMRVQWDGPWCDRGRLVRARYRHTHWVVVRMAIKPKQPLRYPKSGWPGREVFDINAMSCGGWLSWEEWANDLIPWLIKECAPKANGNWWPTHCWEVRHPTAGRLAFEE